MIRIRSNRRTDGSAGHNDLLVIIKDQTLAGTGGKLGLIKLHPDQLCDLDYGAARSLTSRANLAE